MREPAAKQGLGVGLEGARAQVVLDEPANRAARVGLEPTGGHRRLLDEGRPGLIPLEAAQHCRRYARLGGGERPGALGLGGSLGRRPGHLGERAAAELERVREQRPHVVEEERRRREPSLLVGGPAGQDEALGRPGCARVEEVAFVGQRIARREREPGLGQPRA